MHQPRLPYPPAHVSDVIDTIHGVKVPDPYRWLEDDHSAGTAAWVDAENALTRTVLEGPVRNRLVGELTALYDFPRASVPVKHGGRCFFTRNSGLQNQAVLYVQDGPGDAPRALLDPNALSDDGTTALTVFAPSEDGLLVGYGLSIHGSDRQQIRVLEVATGAERAECLEWAKFTSIAWTQDGCGFYYTRFPEPGSVAAGDENYFNSVHYHRLGDPQVRDRRVYDRPNEREIVFDVHLSEDDRWLVITAHQGSSDKSEVYLLDRHDAAAAPQPLFVGFHSAYSLIDAADGKLFFRTDDFAALGRVIAVDPDHRGQPVIEVVAEAADKLSMAAIVCGTLVLSYLHNASDRVRLFDLRGTPAGEMSLPAIGSLSGLSGRPSDDELFLGFTSFTYPPTNFRYTFENRTLTTFGDDRPQFDPRSYETTQVWYPSKDGVLVSMFLVHRRGLPRDSARPVLLTGYGGFNISLTPAFDPGIFPLLDRGGIYAVANLRGGGEYGEAWHQAGMFERKQTVFDDFTAAAEWLVANGFTRPARLGIEGGSNGGLLTAAVMLQRPDAFGAVICRVPVADMLRYHLFTVGRFWISEYGSADYPEQFTYLLKYSPYHNVNEQTTYPPILITTADTDDRVAPGMARKFAARLQAARGNASPVLIRIDIRAGHGAGKPISKVIDEEADLLSFLFKYLDIENEAESDRAHVPNTLPGER